jgi:phenylalanyl-tRNA synthetase alpha subunit
MDNVSGGMKSLCENILSDHQDRKSFIKQIKGQAEAIRDNSRKFLADSKKIHEEMSKDLRKGLRERRENLIKNVNTLREDFRKKEREVKADLAEASKVWNKMNETLRSKKTKSPD